jgi:hypothetical protein
VTSRALVAETVALVVAAGSLVSVLLVAVAFRPAGAPSY